MIIIPAIDLKDGACVRLRQGRAQAVTVYSGDPVATAEEWVAQGARSLHVVDLDGAFRGRPVHADVIGRIARAVRVPVQAGGGCRTDEEIRRLLDSGVARVVIGTRALESADALQELVRNFGERLAVGIDARAGHVQVQGWLKTTAVQAVDLAAAADAAGVRTLIYTDTVRDGMLRGPNTSGVRALCQAVTCNVVAAGGIASGHDIRSLRDLRLANLAGAIVGKALYDGAVTLKELMESAGSP